MSSRSLIYSRTDLRCTELSKVVVRQHYSVIQGKILVSYYLLYKCHCTHQIHQHEESAHIAPFAAEYDTNRCVTLRTVSFLSNHSLTGHALFGQPSKKFKLTFQHGGKLKMWRYGMAMVRARMDVTVQFRHCHEGFHLVPLTVVSTVHFII